jgi:outer membrane lipoprotein
LPLAVALLLVLAGLLGGCTVMSSQTMAEAEPAIPFPRLVSRAEDYEGRVVVIGGYVLEVRNRGQATLLVVLQAPLSSGQEPLKADLSEGRFMVLHDRFLDPEVFTKGRKVTVGGIVKGLTPEVIGDQPYDYLTLEAREIFLWERLDYAPLSNPRYSRPYPYDDPRYNQFDYRRY